MADRYAVIGNPVAHSKSPLIHAAFARQTGEAIEYGTLLAPPRGFAQAVANFRAGGGKGLNVTVPFKFDALAFAEELTARARSAGAVNTLNFSDGKVLGDNTDGVGLIRDIRDNLSCRIAGCRVLLMGAGGAAHGVAQPLAAERPAALMIANRTAVRAETLAGELRAGMPESETVITGGGYDALAGEFDIVINATAASLDGDVPPLPAHVFASHALAYDMMYGSEPTPFLRFAAQRGVDRLADGVGMLVEQAAESFFVWRGVRPETAPVIKVLKGGRMKAEG
jgi:shikimate dehydrogenase